MFCTRAVCCAALFAGAVVSICIAANPAAAEDKSPGKGDEGGAVSEQEFSVAGLVTTSATAAELVDLCVAVVEPSSWEQAGGRGKIKAGRRALVVTNTTAVRDRVRALVAALAKQPALDEESAKEPPKTPHIDVATMAHPAPKPKPGQTAAPLKQTRLALYPVADLVWNGDQTPADFDSLIMLIESSVAPQSWATNSSEGELKPYSNRGALVVHNTPEVLADLDQFLAAIRKLPKLSPAHKKPDPLPTITLAKNLGAKRDAEARLYHVADLALADGGSANINPIIQRVMDAVATETWQRNGGDGSVRKLVDRGGLIITNTAEAHRAVETELAKMRAELAAKSAPPKPSPPGRGRTPRSSAP
jgi:hypothetical protein